VTQREKFIVIAMLTGRAARNKEYVNDGCELDLYGRRYMGILLFWSVSPGVVMVVRTILAHREEAEKSRRDALVQPKGGNATCALLFMRKASESCVMMKCGLQVTRGDVDGWLLCLRRWASRWVAGALRWMEGTSSPGHRVRGLVFSCGPRTMGPFWPKLASFRL